MAETPPASPLAPLDHELLLEFATGYLGSHDTERQLRHTLLSVMGVATASWIALYRLDPAGWLRLEGARGPDRILREKLRPSPRLVRLVERQRVVDAGGLSWVRRELKLMDGLSGAHRLVAIGHTAGLGGMIALGPPLFESGEGRRDAALLAALGSLAARALQMPPPEDDLRSQERRERGARASRPRHPGLSAIVGDGSAVQSLLDDIMTVADYDYPVLVGGETGTGKELVARAIHAVGPRAAQPFVTVECTSIPRDLFESTLFGSERGAYSGAVERRRGLLQVAGRGTVFLDEIGDMPLEQQAKLLGAIERREFRPVGAELPLRFEGRFVAASHRDLAQLVREDRFRADLFHRLFVFRIMVPPLRERRDEIRQLAVHFLEKHRGKGRILRLSEGAARELSRRDYHGNIRELERCLMRAIVRARGGSQLLPEHLDPEETGPVASGSVMSPAPSALTGTPAIATPVVATVSSAGLPDYEEARREYLKTVLRRSRGNVVEASRIMGKPATSVHALIRKLGLHEFLKECRRR